MEKEGNGKTVVKMGEWESREDVIGIMKERGIKVKCIPKSSVTKKGGIVEPGLEIRFITTSTTESVFKRDTKKKAIEILGLTTKEDCDRINRELES